ncbi:ADP-ribosyltransferase [Methanobrevibacter sp. DSM 116169]|uniref:ADP-ribosyltransferase n=1 Tax=Methanobrevibacter sp. DSM 116169 TaxID=3242727 RepID=UPI0038FCF65D
MASNMKNIISHIKNTSKKIKNRLTNKQPAKMIIDGKTIYGVGENFKDRNNFKNKYGISKNNLSKKEYDFIKIYTGEGYSPLNEYLRKKIKKIFMNINGIKHLNYCLEKLLLVSMKH